MPSFRYKGRDATGSLVTGQLHAVSPEAAATELFGSSITPIDIREVNIPATASAQKARNQPPKALPGKRDGGSLGFLFQSNKVEITDLIIFSRQMYSLSKAGLPLDRALRGLEQSISSIQMRRVLNEVSQQLEKGMDLAGALARHPKIFSPLYLAFIHVGENTGRLDLAFEQAGKYLELERNTAKQVKSAVRYPIFVIVAISIAFTVIMMFVIPVFAETFERFDAQLPWQTVLLIDISNFLLQWWAFIAGSVLALILFVRSWMASSRGRLKWDRYKLSIPMAGEILERVALSRFSRTFAMMMRAGVPVVQSLAVIARAVGNQYIGENVLGMRDNISRGESLYSSAIKSGMFSPLVLQMISVGEESGSIDTLLNEVADFYDTEIEYDLKKLSSAIEPILIVLIAGMVLVLALGVFLPIWDLANAVRV